MYIYTKGSLTLPFGCYKRFVKILFTRILYYSLLFVLSFFGGEHKKWFPQEIHSQPNPFATYNVLYDIKVRFN